MKILVISDIHGNAEALRAVVKAEPDADHTIFLGDALLSGPQAAEVAELLDKLNLDIAIMGNHDEELLDPSRFAHWPKEWVALNEWIIETLDPAVIQSFADYQPNGHYELGGLEMYLHTANCPAASPKPCLMRKMRCFCGSSTINRRPRCYLATPTFLSLIHI